MGERARLRGVLIFSAKAYATPEFVRHEFIHLQKAITGLGLISLAFLIERVGKLHVWLLRNLIRRHELRRQLAGGAQRAYVFVDRAHTAF